MGGVAVRSRWACLVPGCDEGGEGAPRDVDKAAEKHSKTASHGTVTWSEPTLPIKVPKG